MRGPYFVVGWALRQMCSSCRVARCVFPPAPSNVMRHFLRDYDELRPNLPRLFSLAFVDK